MTLVFSPKDKLAIDLLLNLKSTVIHKTLNIIIFDWDDTLFPTDFFQSRPDMLQNPKLIPEEINLELRTLAENIIRVITYAKLCGNVSIISNASKGWLQLCFDVIPEINPILQTINIISAQDNFKHQSNDPAKWKDWAFYHHINNTIKSYSITNNNYNLVGYIGACYKIILIGDSICERNALKNSAKYLKTQYEPDSISIKTIKLIENPTFKKIINQLELIISLFFNLENISLLKDEDYTL
jgi:hypothetical protein